MSQPRHHPKSYFTLPDTLAEWPWRRQLNPHYAKVKAASDAWIEAFHAFRPEAQRVFRHWDFNLLASLALCHGDEEHLRTACDLMNVFFLYDEYSDHQTLEVARQVADIMMDALRNPHKPRPEDESVVGEIVRQFWERAIETASETSQRRFLSLFESFLEAIMQEVADRSSRTIRDVDSYLALRRGTIATRPTFAVLLLTIDLSDWVLEHAMVQELERLATDMIIISNDLCSYNVEQARGDDAHNLVTVVRNQYGLDLDGAMSWIDRYHKDLVQQFLDRLENREPLSSRWSPGLDEQVVQYINGLGELVRGHDSWCFETPKYFGVGGKQIQENRVVELLAKKGN